MTNCDFLLSCSMSKLKIITIISICISLLYSQRDLSTPSSRLIGHWKTPLANNREAHWFFSKINLDTKSAEVIMIDASTGKTNRVQYRIFNEDTLKEEVVTQLVGDKGYKETYIIPKDGLSFKMQFISKKGKPCVLHAEYVDDQVEPGEEFNYLVHGTKVEITDWTNRLSGSESYYFVEGVLENTGAITAERVKVTVKALDKNGKLVALEQGYAEPYKLSPGEEGVFQIMIDNIPRIKKFSVSVKWDN